MSLPKLLAILTVTLFLGIGLAFVKKSKEEGADLLVTAAEHLSVDVALGDSGTDAGRMADDVAEVGAVENDLESLPHADHIDRLFMPGMGAPSIVKTVTYKSGVPWLQGRPAWVADYAKHYRTSRHFIARSLNRGPDYFSQNVSNGDRFNVLDEDKDVRFHLLVDLSRCHAWLYYYDADLNERALLKDYTVGVGRKDDRKVSGSLTPLGTYRLGERIAIYKPKGMGWFNGEKVEMIRTFGTRWIPFEDEVDGCTAPAKGFGIHGAPWSEFAGGDTLVEERECIGKYESDGCIRFVTEDIEEIFSIVITRPTTIEIVKSFEEAQLPGKEVTL